MSSPDAGIDAGNIRFFDNYIPALEADTYTLSVNQHAVSSDANAPLDEKFASERQFAVAAPRFALPPGDIQSVFPPANACGKFDQNFAHVVLNARALPWERLIDRGNAPTRGTPWMALLLFTEKDLVVPPGVVEPVAIHNPTLVATYPTFPANGGDSLASPADKAVLGPTVSQEPTDEKSCQAIEITTQTFERLLPRATDLRWLAHVRQLGAALAHKADDQAGGDGWFSVVIGNRLPRVKDVSMRYIGHLVSLEGFLPYLTDAPKWPAGVTRVRLASLASWSFTSESEAGDFAALARNLIAGPVGAIAIDNGGSGYTSPPDVAILADAGSGAVATAAIDEQSGKVTDIVLVAAGSGYLEPPRIGLSGGGGTGATASATLSRNLASRAVASITLDQGGSGYASAPEVTFAADTGSGATATAVIDRSSGKVTKVVLVSAGSGYLAPPKIGFSGGGGSGATATATLAWPSGEPLRLRLPVPPSAQEPTRTPALDPGALARAALNQGYVPLAYDLRVGDRSYGWYRGPFTPAPIASFDHPRPWPSSAAATIYDPATGTFDLSYAVAWEAGRLLAIASRAQASGKVGMAKAVRRDMNRLRERLAFAVPDAARPEAPVGPLFVDWMAQNLAGQLPLADVKAQPPRPVATAPAATGPRPAAATELRTMLAKPAAAAQLVTRAQAALREAQFAPALDFLAALRLLEGVPFANLVPHSAMLPAESIRFFHVDPNYLEALSDGASSIALHTSRDVAQAAQLRAPLRQAAIARAQGRRAQRIGLTMLTAAGTADDDGDPVAGFLLRSAIVSGWPGLEVKAYGAIVPGSNPLASDPASLIRPLRFERLAPDVLLCLYPRLPAWIELNEPNEGLAFGIEGPANTTEVGKVALRYLDDAQGHIGKATGKTVSFTEDYLRDTDADTGVIRVDAWQRYLAGEAPSGPAAWGSATFAVQMVRAPEQIIFQIQPNPALSKEAQHA